MERTWLLTCHVTVASSPQGLDFPSYNMGMSVWICFCCGYFEYGLDEMRVGLLLDSLRTPVQEPGLQEAQFENHCARWSQSFYYPTKIFISKKRETLLNQKTEAQNAARLHCSTHPPQVSIRYKFRHYDKPCAMWLLRSLDWCLGICLWIWAGFSPSFTTIPHLGGFLRWVRRVSSCLGPPMSSPWPEESQINGIF